MARAVDFAACPGNSALAAWHAFKGFIHETTGQKSVARLKSSGFTSQNPKIGRTLGPAVQADAASAKRLLRERRPFCTAAHALGATRAQPRRQMHSTP